jgi:hypothetical protein
VTNRKKMTEVSQYITIITYCVNGLNFLGKKCQNSIKILNISFIWHKSVESLKVKNCQNNLPDQH